jgi:hypothetical protein
MENQTVDFEDRLTPVGSDGSDLFLFSASDGAVYRSGEPLALHLPPVPPRTFAVPGDDCLYSVSDSDGTLSVHRRQLTGAGHEIIVLAPSDGTVPVAVIAGGPDRYVVLRHQIDPAAATVVSLQTGHVLEWQLPVGARPLFMTNTGHVVYQEEDTWGTSETNTTPEPGTVTSWSARGFIVATAPKGQRAYTHIQNTSRRTLEAPNGWEIRQAILHRGGIAMICIHPVHGYATWDGLRLNKLAGTAIAYPLGDHEPAIRRTSYSAGSSWSQGTRTWPGVIPARSDLLIHTTGLDGCPSVHITTARRSESLLITMHGGPDSLEWDDLRYGGMYRELVAGGTDVLIVNYAGSQGLGTSHQRRAWRAWAPTLTSLGAHVQAFCIFHGYSRLTMLGVSFGAWAALIASTNADVQRVVVASPILRLATHLQRHSADPGFEAWSTERFGGDGTAARIGDELLSEVRSHVVAIVPESDRTIDVAATKYTCEKYRWDCIGVTGGHYPTTLADAAGRWEVLQRAITN